MKNAADRSLPSANQPPAERELFCRLGDFSDAMLQLAFQQALREVLSRKHIQALNTPCHPASPSKTVSHG